MTLMQFICHACCSVNRKWGWAEIYNYWDLESVQIILLTTRNKCDNEIYTDYFDDFTHILVNKNVSWVHYSLSI